jgi:membrane-bound lytic murein transglycosylase B
VLGREILRSSRRVSAASIIQPRGKRRGPPVYPEATVLQGVEYEAEAKERQRISERRAREVLEEEVEKKRSAGAR